MTYGEFKDLSQAIQSWVTIIAVFAGTYFFWRKRRTYPRAELTHEIVCRPLSQSKTLIRVIARLRNTGEILLYVADGFTRLQRITPCTIEMGQMAEEGIPLRATAQEKIAWPQLERIDLVLRTPSVVEPGETEEVYFDFVVDNSVGCVIAYSHITNKKLARRKKIGWGKSTIIDVRSPAVKPI